MAAPTIPPRPTRSQNTHSGLGSSMDVPRIPPRPAKRSVERSISPHRDTFARSPLNDPAFLHNHQHQHKEGHLSAEVPPRPPSVTLPSIGQEGSEYASLEDLQQTLSREVSREERAGSPQQMKNVAGDLPLYQPKASVPSSTAKSRIQTVTRTDSSQAVAAGIGKLAPDDRSTHGGDSGRSDSSAGNHTRPGSMYKDDEEHGIPEIGVQVPMYPNAGDVQAPTPSPYEQGSSTGVGYFNKGGLPSGRHHGRTKSGREVFHGPPGSYGLHGHGIIPNDEFEQKWYARHPEDMAREKAGEYGPHIQENRKDYHWVGDDLVKLVHSSGSKGIGTGTSGEAVGTPDEQIGYIASEEFASRMASPKPPSGRPGSISSKSGTKVESPLRQINFPADPLARSKTHESDVDEDVIHIDPPSHRTSKIGGGGYDPPTVDLGPQAGNTEEDGGYVSERGYGVPILASDEIEKHPDAEWRQPAVSPELERRGSGDYTINDPDGQPSYITKQRTHSRSSSRNNSIHSGSNLNLKRFATPNELEGSGTPLESTKEYEPLFPDEEESGRKPKTAINKLKRSELARHQFPSQDVWEDTPSSLQLETTVETPQAPEEPKSPGVGVDAAKVIEEPEAEDARKEHIAKEDQESFLPEHTKRFASKHLAKERLGAPTRPGLQQRFPSHDIWEDAPDHGQLVTTVSTPQTEATNEYIEESPVVEKPAVPARRAVPARPQKVKDTSPVEKKAAPTIPEKPKPPVPVRPSKPLTKSSEKVPTLGSQAAEAPQPKAKPQVPARPGGSKIAALQAGFLKDLNSKLGLGPQAPKVKEPEPEKDEEARKPLQDARKGRAKGPQRRKPTSSPAPATAAIITAEVAAPKLKLELSSVSTIWSIDDDGEVDVPAARMAEKIQAALKASGDPASTEKVDEPEADIMKEVEEKGDVTEPEEADLTETVTREPTKSVEPEPEPVPELTPEIELDAQGGVPLENKVGVNAPSEQESAVEPTESELPSPEALKAPEPVDKAREEVETESKL